jgi:hypothetical protein
MFGGNLYAVKSQTGTIVPAQESSLPNQEVVADVTPKPTKVSTQ